MFYSLAAFLFHLGSHNHHKIPARWTTRIVSLVCMSYVIGRTNGAVIPSADLSPVESVAEGVHVKSSTSSANIRLEKLANVEISGEGTDSRVGVLPNADVNSPPGGMHPSTHNERSTENQRLDAALPAHERAGHSVNQGGANSEQKDMDSGLAKTWFVPNDQDDITDSLPGVDFNNDEAYEMFILDYRARLVKKMKEQRRNAKMWLKDLQAPVHCSQQIHDDWVYIKSAAWYEYNLANRWKICGMLLRWFDFVFRNWKWKEEKLSLQFLKIRMAGTSTGLNHLRAVLELDLVRRRGFLLGNEELKLIEHVANAGADIGKLTPEEMQLINELPKKTLNHRRLAKTTELIEHISSLHQSNTDRKVLDVITSLAILQDKAVKRTGWTMDETKLVMAIGNIKDKRKIGSSLNEDQKAFLRTLVKDSKYYKEDSDLGPLGVNLSEVAHTIIKEEQGYLSKLPGASVSHIEIYT